MTYSTIVQRIMEIEHFKELTPIQSEILNMSNKTRDVIGISSTGSGKTHAFFMPIMEQIDPNKNEVQAVISTPTRELAYQLYERCKKLTDVLGMRVKLVTGGSEKKTSTLLPHIVIGTPGRMKDVFLQDKILRLDTAKVMVIDEADMTLEFGFLEDIDTILSHMNKKIQLMVFSATVPEALKPFLKKYLHDPYMIQIDEKENFQANVKHILVPCKHKTYGEKLLDILPAIQPYVCLIFANTNEEAEELAKVLRAHDYDLVEIHGSMESRERLKSIRLINAQKKSYIVATDIAARGIDLDGVTHVISCGFPKDLKYYIHRAGRTGRANRDGICIALYQDKDAKAIQTLSKEVKFHHEDVKKGQWVELKPYFPKKKPHQKDEFDEEIERIVHRKKQKVKPGYKKKQKQEIDRLKRKRKRQMIQKDIQRQKKERAKQKQREKANRS
ncbi:MAG: DEAD/DEAH box helicase [Absicoccus porci]|uniref:DEAD/DEAH box helicase n=1 Tax=Absicoccus porci TaxID=2486576 RepID=UPI002353E82B|nr:DEAD/DEAH box helicase [Absicoccus porci]MCI6087868.1 DEAD/DEAH box helicase [Absicoccus porci]